MELFFKDEMIGNIVDITRENNWQYGIFKENENYEKYKEFLESLVCEDGFDESKFDNELLNDENWKVKLDSEEFDIYIPAIYEDGDIEFRYR